MASRPNLELLPPKARRAATASWIQSMGTPFNITERLCLAITAALPNLDQAAPPIIASKAVEQERERLLGDESIRRGERVLDDDRSGEPMGEARTDYALVRRILLAALDQEAHDAE